MDDFNKCPIGVKHDQQIEGLKEIFNMAIQRLEEKVDSIQEDVNEGFANVDNRFNSLEERFTNLEDSLPETIDDRIKDQHNKTAGAVAKWVLVSLIGSTIILVFGRWVLAHLGM